MENGKLSPEILEYAKLLKRGAQAIVPEFGLEQKLAKSARTGKPLKVKLGLDPTAPDIHLGFAVVLRKLRQFQDLGHQVIIIIGDYTALIGDPSGRSATRPMLSPEDIRSNAETYVAQLTRILDRTKTVVRFNGEWLGELDFASLVLLASKITVARIMEREDFANRFSSHQPISLHELLYPLAQAYDSVAIEADVEMGGQDQTFNILAGRDLQEKEGQEPQIALFMPLLVGLDGVKKMSKSLGNYVGIAEAPDVMFAKLMSISDAMMRDYFVLCTDVPIEEIDRLLSESEQGSTNPKDVKRRLAREIVEIYHPSFLSDEGIWVHPAARADDEWQRVHSSGELPLEIPELPLSAELVKDGSVWLCRLLVAAGMAKSNGEAQRLVTQGAVTIGGKKLLDPKSELPTAELAGAVLKVGARRFLRLVVHHE